MIHHLVLHLFEKLTESHERHKVKFLQSMILPHCGAISNLDKSELKVRIIGNQLPGLRFTEREPVYVGIQNKTEVVDPVPGDSKEVVFEFKIEVVNSKDPDYRGPFIHGKKGERFLYLSWGEVRGKSGFEMFRRAKLHLSVLGSDAVKRAISKGLVLEGVLRLTDEKGGPLCASVRPPKIKWKFVPIRLAK